MRSIVEGILLKPMFETPSDKTIKRVVITPECVTEGAEPLIERETKKTKKSS